MSLVHLHVHSGYSLLDSMVRLPDLVEELHARQSTACALTDHGTIAGAVKFTDLMLKKGMKPIIGQEFYIAPDSRLRKQYARGEHSASHLILLAKNEIGYKNLMALSTRAWTEGFYRKPRIDHELLREHHEGLICTSACIGGDIAIHLKAGMDIDGDGKVPYSPELAMAKIAWYFNLFGDDFYLEMQSHNDQAHDLIAEFYRERYPTAQLVPTADCHYIHYHDGDTHDTLLAMQTVKHKSDPERWRFPTDQCYLKTEDEMLGLFSAEEIENTQRVADKVTFEMPLRKHFFMPDLPEDITLGDEVGAFLAYCEEGLEALVGSEPPQAYRDRLKYEMDVFIRAGFVGYALLLFDLLQFCRKRSIYTGDGRGSGAGSLVLYALGITKVDPIRYDCPFERFINAGRLERFAPPDVDLDFPQSRRGEVLQYLRDRYGADQVCQIGTYATLGPAALVRKLQVPLGISPAVVSKLTAMIPGGEGSLQGAGAAGEAYGLSIDDIYLSIPSFQQTIDELGDQGKALLHYARGLGKLGTNASKHASGVIITNQPVKNLLPLMVVNDTLLAQFDMFDAEACGVVKYDILGLKTLDVLAYGEEMVRTHDDPDFNLDAVDLDDPLPYTLLHNGRTVGIFQAEGGGFGRLLPQTKPSTVEDLAVLTSLCRPGPSISGLTQTYVRRRRGEESVTYEIPQLEPILARSMGVMAFQEDIMKIASDLAGYSLAEADDLRKIMGKKQRDKMPAQRAKFLQGLSEVSGVSPVKGEKLWNEIAAMAEYVFNRSHAIAYSRITAKCAWLKYYYPAYFLAGAMTSEVRGDGKELPTLLQDARFLGVNLLTPEINQSSEEYLAVDRTSIRVGLLGIHQVGEKAVAVILAERNAHGPFTSIDDFRRRLPQKTVNKTVMAALERAGAFDVLTGTKRLSTTSRLFEEFALFGFFLSGHPCQRMRSLWLNEVPEMVTLSEIEADYEREAQYVHGQNGRRRVFVYRERRVRAIVTKMEQRKSKRDQKIMLFVEVEDETGASKMIINQKQLQKFGNPPIIKGALLDLLCRKSDPDRWAGYIEPSMLTVLPTVQ